MKYGNVYHYIIDWTFSLNDNKDPFELVEKLYNSVSGKPRKYVDNTLEFIRWSAEEKAELEKKAEKVKPKPFRI
jgi:ABC-type Zn2+ transport system substrate-binding protein/surface adhesin